jgi:hypothetical protein
MLRNSHAPERSLSSFPAAQRIEVPSITNPRLAWQRRQRRSVLQIKRNVLVLGTRKALKCEANNRSSDSSLRGMLRAAPAVAPTATSRVIKGFRQPITTSLTSSRSVEFIARQPLYTHEVRATHPMPTSGSTRLAATPIFYRRRDLQQRARSGGLFKTLPTPKRLSLPSGSIAICFPTTPAQRRASAFR